MKEKNPTYSPSRHVQKRERKFHSYWNEAVYGMRCVLKRNYVLNLEDLKRENKPSY